MMRIGSVPISAIRRQGGLVIKAAAPAPTPVLGSELLTNGDMETGNPPTGWTATNGATLAGAVDERTGGVGVQCIIIARNGTDYPGAYQNVVAVANAWYMGSAWIRKVDAGGLLTLRTAAGIYLSQSASSGNINWAKAQTATRAVDATLRAHTQTNDNTGANGLAGCKFDDVSIKPITIASILTGGGNALSRYAIYDAAVTVAASYQAGLVCCLDSAADPKYYIHAYIDRNTNKLYLLKVVNGTTTDLLNGDYTYAAGGQVRIVVVPGSSGLSNAQVAVYYASTLIGSAQTVDLSAGFGTIAKAFDTSGTATVVLEVNN